MAGVYAAALLGHAVHPQGLQQALNYCTEARYEVDITHFLVTMEAQQRQGHATVDRRLIEARFAAIFAEWSAGRASQRLPMPCASPNSRTLFRGRSAMRRFFPVGDTQIDGLPSTVYAFVPKVKGAYGGARHVPSATASSRMFSHGTTPAPASKTARVKKTPIIGGSLAAVTQSPQVA